ncbi:MAG TPA: aspartate aminotransferase [Amoebophilaceae bacterium]|nr:aspartate aminotransferase [Amoebophilaceae bacterium]
MKHFLANRINALPKSATIAMNQQAIDLQAQGHDIINLSIGEPDFKTPLSIQQAAKKAIDAGIYFSYTPVAGYADLRAAIADKLCQENNIRCEPSQIVVSNGAKQAIANVFSCLLNPGDEVVVYTPYWVSYVAIIQWAGGKPVLIQGKLANNFEATPEQLDQAITSKTKAVIFSSPCNPTGHVFSKHALEAMATVLAKHAPIFVIADEIYEYINFVGEHTSMGALPGMQDRVITINGFSKGFAMTGWRIGYMAAPAWLAKACEKIQGQTTGAPSSIAQRAALAAIQGDRKVIQLMTDTYRKRRDLCLELLKEIPGFRSNTPLGGFFLFPDVSDYFGRTDGHVVIQDAHELCMYLLREAHVSVVAGSGFGEPNCVRISYAVTEDQLRAALQRIQEVLAKLKMP